MNRETINFDVSRISSHTIIPMGQIQRLSVAVLVDGTYTQPEVAAGEPPAEPVYEPRIEEQLLQITEIVKRAVGFDAERGDLIELQNFAFRSPLADFPIEEVPFWKSPELFVLLPGAGRLVMVLGGLTILSLMVLRPALNQLMSGPVTGGGMGGGVRRSAVGAAAGGLAAPTMSEEQMALEVKAAELAIPLDKDQAKNVADAIKSWLRE